MYHHIRDSVMNTKHYPSMQFNCWLGRFATQLAVNVDFWGWLYCTKNISAETLPQDCIYMPALVTRARGWLSHMNFYMVSHTKLTPGLQCWNKITIKWFPIDNLLYFWGMVPLFMGWDVWALIFHFHNRIYIPIVPPIVVGLNITNLIS